MPERSDLATHRVTAMPGPLVAVTIVGELDMSNAGHLQQWITEAAARHPAAAIELDLTEVRFIDSTIIRALVTTHRTLTTGGRAFRVRGAAGPVARTLETTGVLATLTGDAHGS